MRKMDTGEGKCLDTEYNGGPWEWRPWEWRTLGVVSPGSGRPREWRAVTDQSLRCSPPTLTFQVQIPPAHNFYNFTSFYELLKSYREGLSSRTSLVITHNFMILRVGCR